MFKLNWNSLDLVNLAFSGLPLKPWLAATLGIGGLYVLKANISPADMNIKVKSSSIRLQEFRIQTRYAEI